MNINIKDKAVEFKFGIKAQKEIEDAFDINISKMDFENLRIDDIITIFYCCMKDKNDIRKNDLLELLDEQYNIKELSEILEKLFKEATGDMGKN
jgi:SUMO ligase MMS21 Smc5/6 complex component